MNCRFYNHLALTKVISLNFSILFCTQKLPTQIFQLHVRYINYLCLLYMSSIIIYSVSSANMSSINDSHEDPPSSTALTVSTCNRTLMSSISWISHHWLSQYQNPGAHPLQYRVTFHPRTLTQKSALHVCTLALIS